MKKETKVHSVRISIELSQQIEELCKNLECSVNDLITECITRTYSSGLGYGKMSALERILFHIKPFIHCGVHNGKPYPRIIEGDETDDDDEYAGQPQILVGDDTLIREKDGRFYVFSYHYEDEEPFWMQENEVIDYVIGNFDAYGIPMEVNNETSYHYLKGYNQTLNYLVECQNEYIESYELDNTHTMLKQLSKKK